jgi:hypothetical protein
MKLNRLKVKFENFDYYFIFNIFNKKVPVKFGLEELGSNLISKNESNDFQLLCKYKLKSLNGNEEITFFKNGSTISKYNPDYYIYKNNSLNNFVHNYLKFNIKLPLNYDFNGKYGCNIKLESPDLGKTSVYSTNQLDIVISQKGNIKFYKTLN